MADAPVIAPTQETLTDVPFGMLRHLRGYFETPRYVELAPEEVEKFLADLVAAGIGRAEGKQFILTPHHLVSGKTAENLELVTQTKRFLQENQRYKLYLTDIASLLDDTFEYLQNKYAGQHIAVINELNSREEFRTTALELIVVDGKFSEEKAFDQRDRLQAKAEALALALQKILGITQDNSELKSLKDIVIRLIDSKNLIEFWPAMILPLAKSYEKTEVNSFFVNLEVNLEELETGQYIAQEFPLVLDHYTDRFVELLRDQADVRNKLPNETLQRISPETYKSQNFYFGTLHTLNPDQKSESHHQVVREFLTFYEKVIEYLIGDKKVEVAAAAAAATEDGGGSEMVPEPPKLVPQDDAVSRVAEAVAEKIFQDLDLDRFTPETMAPQTLTLFYQLLKTQLTDTISRQLRSSVEDALKAAAGIYDPETGLYLTGPILDAWITANLDKLSADFRQTLGDFDTFTQRLVNSVLQTLDALSNPETEVKTNYENLTQVTIPENVQALLLQLRRETEPDAQPQAILSLDEWRQLNPRAKAALATSLLGDTQARITNTLIVYFLASQPELKKFTARTLPPEIREALENQIQAGLATLSYPEFAAILLEPNKARFLLFHKLSNELVNPEFQKTIAPFIEKQKEINDAARAKQKTAIEKEFEEKFGIDGIHVDNLNTSVETLIILHQNPAGFIDSLDNSELQGYFHAILSSDATISAEQALRFKALLKKYVSLRLEEVRYRGASESVEDTKAHFGKTFKHVEKYGTRLFVTPYGEQKTKAETDALDKDAKALYYRELEMRRDLVEQLWKDLSESEKYRLFETYNLVVPQLITTAIVPSEINALDITKIMDARGGGNAAPQGRLAKLANRFKPKKLLSPTERLSQAANQAAVNTLSAAANAVLPGSGLLLKAASMLTGNDLKKTLALGGAALAFVIGRGIAMLGTVGGAIGGAIGATVGFALGNIPGAATGLIIGSNIGGTILPESLGDIFNRLLSGQSAATPSTLTPTAVATPTPALLPTAAIPTAIATSVGIGLIAIVSTHDAFLDPLTTSFQATEQSKYVTLAKTASPTSFENEASPKAVHYTITITPRQDESGQVYAIKINDITDTFSNLGKNTNGVEVSLTSPVNNDNPSVPDDFFTEPVTIEYDQTMTEARDVLVQNRISITFEVQGVPEATAEVLNAQASVRVGNPKLGCFEFIDHKAGLVDGTDPVTTKPWLDEEKNKLIEAYLAHAGGNERFNSLVCTAGSIRVYRAVEARGYGGFKPSPTEIVFYNLAFSGSVQSLEYTIIHELGHIIQSRNPGLMDSFLTDYQSGSSDYPCFTYPLACRDRNGNIKTGEVFAEAIALYVVHTWYTFHTTYQGIYDFPGRNLSEYNWVKANIYDGQEWLSGP
jgi:hypothetical protein